MRLAWILPIVALPAVSHAQWTTNLGGSMGSIKRQLDKPAAPQDRPLPPRNPNLQDRLVVHSAEEFNRSGSSLIASGGVHITFAGYDIYGDRVVGDVETRVFTLEGKARLVGEAEAVEAESVTADFRHGTFRFIDGSAILKPAALENRTTGDAYLRAARGGGTESEYLTVDGSFTTCNLEHPHFHFEAETTRIKPGKFMVLRHARVKLFGKTILHVPYLMVPIVRNAEKYIPQVGQSPDEGFFVKSRVSTPLRGDDYFDTRLDYMSKLGTGLGVDWFYDDQAMRGELSAYALTGTQSSAVISSRHSQRLGSGDLTVDAAWQRNNYLTAPDSTLWNARAQYALPWAGGTTRFGYYRVSSDSGAFTSNSESFSVGDSRTLRGGLRTRIDVTRSAAESGTTKAERVDLRFNANQEFRSFTADLIYNRSIPVGEDTNFFNASDQTPMLSLKTTGQRLLGGSAGRKFPFQADLSVGELADPSTRDQITRIAFDWALRGSEGSSSNTLLTWGTRFKQGIYSDDTAQYMLGNDLRLSQKIGSGLSANIGYRYQRQFGFTPLSLDRASRGDAFNMDVTYRPSSEFSLTAQSGYDLLLADRGQVAWQLATLRAEWTPSSDFSLRATSIYDTFSQVWGNARLDLNYRRGDLKLAAGARYDGRRSQWSGGNVWIQGFRVGRTTVSALWDFNGYTRTFDAQHYTLTYDLHCAEAVLEIIDNRVGFRAGRQIAFFIRIKALPFESPFGIGQRGQSVGGGGFGS